MSFQDNQRQWDALGRLDPYWAMTGTHKFGTWDVEAFLRTGDHQVARVMQDLQRMGQPLRRTAVLDFGCGVGRLTRAFQAHFPRYLGLDVSAELIAKARELHSGRTTTTFVVSASETLPLADASFDLVYCWAVLQHIAEQARVRRLLGEFVRVLRPDGILVFSALHAIKWLYRSQPRRRLYALLEAVGVPATVLYHRLRLYPQEVHFIPQPQVIAHLQAVGARVLDIKRDTPPSVPHQVRVYYAAK